MTEITVITPTKTFSFCFVQFKEDQIVYKEERVKKVK